MKAKFFLVIMTIVISFGFFVPKLQAVDLNAQTQEQLQANFGTSGFSASPKDPQQIIAGVIKIILTLMGTIFLILIAIASFWYITARGQTDKIEKATSTIRGAVIGLIIVLMAYSITYFVSKNVQKAAGIVPTSGIIEMLTPKV